MLGLIEIVLPVFLIVGAGYAATRAKLFSDPAADGLMVFTQGFAIPCLLFAALARLDLGAVFDWRLLVSFYTGAAICFALGVVGARVIFKRRPGESVAVGFGALFSNSVLLGLPIMERAYGTDALAANFAIIAIHAPFCYLLGITTMEIVRADGKGAGHTVKAVGRAMFRNSLMIGLALGFAVNLSGVELPSPLWAAVDLMVRAALPAALFGLGGILTRYTLSAQIPQAAMVGVLSLIVHPSIAWGLSVHVFDLPIEFVRAAVVTAAMAPGVNTYVFANLYDRAKGVAASAVLLSTALSVLSVSVWLWALSTL
ncbi:AEC family transporter [Roseobacter sp. HKCCA0434]|uniref:AEC family transporter n=1 Tax=Roseobacter sp. HKCCA0434 TaxID=3079297 RepID=UPI002905BCB9|nr:AEC family transporter [Roseobacter sp. HKCCA0434]